MVFQYPEHQLFEETVFKDVCFGPKNQGLPEKDVTLRAYEALQNVGLPEKYFDVSPKDALVLEDSFVGVEAAYKAQIPCIMVPDLLPPQSKQKKETVAIVSSLKDVMKYL